MVAALRLLCASRKSDFVTMILVLFLAQECPQEARESHELPFHELPLEWAHTQAVYGRDVGMEQAYMSEEQGCKVLGLDLVVGVLVPIPVLEYVLAPPPFEKWAKSLESLE